MAVEVEIDVELLKSEIKKTFDLIPDKDAVFAELFCVLKPGGRLQIADVTIQNPVSDEAMRAEIEEQSRLLDESRAREELFPHRRVQLKLLHSLGWRLLTAHLEWIEEVERELLAEAQTPARISATSASDKPDAG